MHLDVKKNLEAILATEDTFEKYSWHCPDPKPTAKHSETFPRLGCDLERLRRVAKNALTSIRKHVPDRLSVFIEEKDGQITASFRGGVAPAPAPKPKAAPKVVSGDGKDSTAAE